MRFVCLAGLCVAIGCGKQSGLPASVQSWLSQNLPSGEWEELQVVRRSDFSDGEWRKASIAAQAAVMYHGCAEDWKHDEPAGSYVLFVKIRTANELGASSVRRMMFRVEKDGLARKCDDFIAEMTWQRIEQMSDK